MEALLWFSRRTKMSPLLNHRIHSLRSFAVLVSPFVWGITHITWGIISGPVFFFSIDVIGVITTTCRKRFLVFLGPIDLSFVSPLFSRCCPNNNKKKKKKKTKLRHVRLKNPGCCSFFVYLRSRGCVIHSVLQFLLKEAKI